MPILTKRYDNWYTLSQQYSDVCLLGSGKPDIDGKVLTANTSFLAAAYNVLHCMLRYGVSVGSTMSANPTEKEKKFHKQNLKNQVRFARKAFDELVKRYPGTVPDYCSDLVDNK